MASQKKPKKNKSAEDAKFSLEKDEKVSLKQVAKDERTHKIFGAACLLTAVFLFIAFTSYLFTWKEDQGLAREGAAVLLPSSHIKASNLLGNFGAYVSHRFFFNGFGLASYFFCSFFFIVGANLLFRKKVFSVGRNLRYVLAGLLFFSVALAFIARGSAFPWGGGVGTMISDWLVRVLGWFGTAALLLVLGLAFFIWRFNPVFKVPEIKRKDNQLPADGVLDDDDGAKLFVEDGLISKTNKGNSLKGSSSSAMISPKENLQEGSDLKMIEKDETQEEEQVTGAISLTLNEKLGAKIAAGEISLEVNAPFEETEAQGNTALEIKQSVEDVELEPMPGPQKEIQIDEHALEIRSDELATAHYDPTLDLRDYKYPELGLLETHGSEKIVHDPAELETNKKQILETLKNYDIQIQRIAATVGPTVTLYEIVPAPGVRISRIKNLEDDIALSLAALGIRIIAPIPGKGTIGIEVPNFKKTVVSMKTLLGSDKFQSNNYSLPIAIGKKIDNENFIVDLAAMPHLLMAGATGQGKSVGINALLVSLLYKKHPSQLKFVLVDPKKVELSLYRTIEKHFLAKLPGEEEPIITDTKKVVHTLNALATLMDIRYDLLKEASCRNIKEYNEKFEKKKLNPKKGHEFLPFIVLVIDEFADLIMTAGKEIEMPIARLAQLARAVGIHLIIATQRPSVNIITGTIKANFPARIAFKVSSKIDSRTILDTGGAEQLIGKGDMLVSYNGEVTRLQCAFVDTPEVDKVCAFISGQRGYPNAFMLPEYVDEKEMEGKEFDLADRDALFEDAARLIVQNQVGSTSLLQRRMKLGYNRAGRLMDQLEQAGVVGTNQGSKARDVLIKTELELEQLLQNHS
ncbi:MAG: DNA translocase FtsK [Bacteroidetes bacterium]|nr:DNA translocase FtsK [Bacteroidota bacterium]MBS1972710.1 DNA translocase FtsK [Bacteroidota bacterium]